ncbi:MAG: radical SAM protein [Ruminococcus sp.]|nr:radical SAM protein [Ruminococcus sp.]
MEYVKAKTILQKTKSTEWFGTDYNMNLYRGCCHGCIYCDSRSKCYGIEDFGKVRGKEDCLKILRDELKRKVRTGVIGTGAMSDPYNPYERTELLTRHSLELINAYEFGCAILSKSALIARDIDLFLAIKEHSPMICKMTVTAADDNISRIAEPNVSPSSERFDALSRLSGAGLFTGIVMMPILPFIEDSAENILGTVRMGHEAGIKFIYADFGMTLREGNREYFYEKLDESFPGLREKYTARYGGAYECACSNAAALRRSFAAECERFGILYKMRDIVAASRTGYKNSQLSFFD